MTSLWENCWASAFMVVTPGLVVEPTGKLKASEGQPFKAESCHCSIQIQDKETKDREKACWTQTVKYIYYVGCYLELKIAVRAKVLRAKERSKSKISYVAQRFPYSTSQFIFVLKEKAQRIKCPSSQ